MGALIKIKNKKCTFYLDGRSVYIRMNDGLSQKFVIQTKSFKVLDQYAYAELVDRIYKRKFSDINCVNKFILNRHRLVPTARNL